MAKEKKCNDQKCPIHSNVKPRGRTFVGVVVSKSPHKSAVVEWGRRKYIPKYERYAKKKTRIAVHNPECIEAEKGDRVMIKECRPLSKTKRFTITEILGKEELFAEKERLHEEGKTKSREEMKEESESESPDKSEEEKE